MRFHWAMRQQQDWYAYLNLTTDAPTEQVEQAVERLSRQATALAVTAPERSQRLRDTVRPSSATCCPDRRPRRGTTRAGPPRPQHRPRCRRLLSAQPPAVSDSVGPSPAAVRCRQRRPPRRRLAAGRRPGAAPGPGPWRPGRARLADRPLPAHRVDLRDCGKGSAAKRQVLHAVRDRRSRRRDTMPPARTRVASCTNCTRRWGLMTPSVLDAALLPEIKR